MNHYHKKVSLAFVTLFFASIAFAGSGLDTIYDNGWESERIKGFVALAGIIFFAVPVMFYGHILNLRREKWVAFGITVTAGCLGNFNPELVKGSEWAGITMIIAVVLMLIQDYQLSDESEEVECDQPEHIAEVVG